MIITTLALLMLAQEGEVPRTETPRPQARSMTITKLGIVATSQTLAATAGAKVLEAGGNAIDAAIAANAAEGLMEPNANGIGGDLFAIVYEAKTKKIYALNSSGWAPTGLDVGLLESKGMKKMPNLGIYSVTIPGAVAGWEALHKKFGKIAWNQLFDPAIHYAENGFPVTEIIGAGWKASQKKFEMSEEGKSVYMPGGKIPQVGEVFKNPRLAKTFRQIKAEGRNGFYRGPVAEAIVAESKRLGGTVTLGDLSEFQPEWVDPISTTYRGWTVYELPPNSAGIAALSMLNIMEKFPLADWGHNSTKALHLMIEAKKLAYADMLKYVGDPRFSKVPVAEMLSKDLATKHAAEIDLTKASCRVTPANLISMSRLPGADTTYMTITDAEGNMVSLIQSNFAGFGSGVVPQGVGFMLHNRGGLFTLDKNEPNTLAPRKRPLHTIIPAYMEKGDTRIAFGIMGGWNQSQAHAQFVANVVDYGHNVQWAMEAPRFTKASFDGCDVAIESRVSEATVGELKKMGHEVRVLGPYSQAMGKGQAVMRNAEGVAFGASDARGDGAAVPQMPAFWKK
ncbi:MAG: gamma-glutamyltransferase [Acidobacteria bacterium]|nr:gamma-glutamyltransferase [Acidobacteriota bacterium]